MSVVLEVRNLKKHFKGKTGFFSQSKDIVKAVDDISFDIEEGKTFGLVGESGCGKTTLARLIVKILKPDSGKIQINGNYDIVFQDPHSSLNPRMRIKDIVGESLFIQDMERKEVYEKVEEVLALVKMTDADCMEKYPHQFSGGERQRIAIARALIRHPKLVVLDEPVSSLDVSIQAGILNILKDLQEDLKLTYLFISHDLRVVEFMADETGVMKDGRIVETASSKTLYTAPKSEYTKKLLSAIPGDLKKSG